MTTGNGRGITPPTHIVGVGASAGGLEALEQLFRNMPSDTGMAFVVVQHLSPDFKSQMSELLSRRTDIEISVARHEQLLEANTIYLMPPKVELIVSGGRLLLTERGEGLVMPIDQFMRSLAHEAGPNSIAVILSGTGSDGSRGVMDIHQAGGLVVVQTEESAKFDGMPKSAIETGVADLILHPEDIAAGLVQHASKDTPSGVEIADTADAVKEGGMRAVFVLLREQYGIDFACYKPSTITRRTERRLLLNRASDLSEYIDRLRSDRSELDALYHDLLIGVTQFFRDEDAFQILEREVIPELVAAAGRGQELRVWVAGCATGEEAYSLAILLTEVIDRLERPISAKVFATDVHKPSLEFASAGLYPETIIAGIGARRLATYFTKEEEGYRVVPDLRRMIVFAPHNVIRDAPFTKLDLITCRNLLIYLQPPVQRKVLSLFHFGLRTGGVLFLGPSESPGDVSDEFETVSSQWKVYKKRRDVRLLPGLRATPSLSVPTHEPTQPRVMAREASMLEAFASLLDTQLPPSVLVNEQHQVLHSFGDLSNLLRLPRGRPSLGLLDMLGGDLKLAVAGALHRAQQKRETVAFGGVRQRFDDIERVLDVRVLPVQGRRISDPYFLVSLTLVRETESADEETPAVALDEASRTHIEALEDELRRTKENLQATIEELEASNEELQATNEELLASNEELQSTNEELHSVNEELYTVNAEYQRKIDELSELTEDMDNLLLSTEVHTLFLDETLCIRKFTPAMADVFNLVDADVGRRIEGFVHSIEIDAITEHFVHTLTTGERYEAEVSLRSGVPYLMRVVPYRGQTGGVVLTLTDISQLRKVEAALREQIEQRDHFLAMLSHELRNPLAAVNNATSLLQRRAPETEVVQKPVALIQRQTRQMQRLLDDLLDVSRITQGKIHLKPEVLDLRKLAGDAVETVRNLAESKKHTLQTKLANQPLWVLADSARVLQVLENLLTNAIKYTDTGGHVTLEARGEGGQVHVAVRDDGVGIDEATRARIFDMFVQAQDTLDRSQGGLGVGLTLVRNLVELHHGRIRVHSDGLGRGSEFEVILPASAPPELVEKRRTSPRAALEGPPRVTIVEDRAEIRESLAELLVDEGYAVSTAATGVDGLELIKNQSPHVALVDIGLPGIDGYELARRVRAEKSDHPRLIAVTGYGRDEDKAAVKEAGFDEHLVKPVMLEDVLEALERLGYAVPAPNSSG